jgi:hypothetical protein
MKKLSLIALALTSLVGCGGGGESDAKFTDPLNTAPQIITLPLTEIYFEESYKSKVTAIDAEGDELIYSLSGAPNGFDIDRATGAIQALPYTSEGVPLDADGKYTIEGVVASVSDGSFTTSTEPFTLTFMVRQLPPSISGAPEPTIEVGQLFTFTPNASDANNDILTFSAKNLPSWMTIDTLSGQLSGTPLEVGLYEDIIITVSDGRFDSVLPEFDLTVLNPTYVTFSGSVQATGEGSDTPIYGSETLIELYIGDKLADSQTVTSGLQFTMVFSVDESMYKDAVRVIYSGGDDAPLAHLESYGGSLGNLLTLAKEEDGDYRLDYVFAPQLEGTFLNSASTLMMEGLYGDDLPEDALKSLDLKRAIEIASFGYSMTVGGTESTWVETIGSNNAYDAMRYFVSSEFNTRKTAFLDYTASDDLSVGNNEDRVRNEFVAFNRSEVVGDMIISQGIISNGAFSESTVLSLNDDGTGFIDLSNGELDVLDIALWNIDNNGDISILLGGGESPSLASSKNIDSYIELTEYFSDLLENSLPGLEDRLVELGLFDLVNNHATSFIVKYGSSRIFIGKEVDAFSSEHVSINTKGDLSLSVVTAAGTIVLPTFSDVDLSEQFGVVSKVILSSDYFDEESTFALPVRYEVNACEPQWSYDELPSDGLSLVGNLTYERTLSDGVLKLHRDSEVFNTDGYERFEYTPVSVVDGVSTVLVKRFETEYGVEKLKSMFTRQASKKKDTSFKALEQDLPYAWNVSKDSWKASSYRPDGLGVEELSSILALSVTDTGFKYGITGFDSTVDTDAVCVGGTSEDCFVLVDDKSIASYGTDFINLSTDDENSVMSPYYSEESRVVAFEEVTHASGQCGDNGRLVTFEKIDLSNQVEAWNKAKKTFTW